MKPTTINSLRARHARTKIHAYAYILKPEFMDNLTQKIWDYNYFLKSGKKEFQQNYTGFNYF